MCAKDVIPRTSRRVLLIWPKSIKNKRIYSIPSKKGKFEDVFMYQNITKGNMYQLKLQNSVCSIFKNGCEAITKLWKQQRCPSTG
jgi:hypothetical protein